MLNNYRLLEMIGQGSFCEVWKAERDGITVALKKYHAPGDLVERQRYVNSLERSKQVHCKQLLQIQDIWCEGNSLYAAMELADGGTLKDRHNACKAEGMLGIPKNELLQYYTEAAKVLDYLHGHRPALLHGNIKPSNVLLVRGVAKMGDFGLNSQSGEFCLTPAYVAPESIMEDKFSPASELFSFAAMYVELRQGSSPFAGRNAYEVVQRIMKEDPCLTGAFHPDERETVHKALSKEPEARFKTCGEFASELNRVFPSP
jgi:eukaryotic-like serine/threonine-protein kinase